jgi:hypothetical protein
MQLQESSAARQTALLAQLMHPHAPPPQAAGDAIAQVVSVSKMLESFGWRPAGGDSDSSPTNAMEFGLKVLQAPLTRIGDKVGEVLARQMERSAEGTPTPLVTTQPTTKPLELSGARAAPPRPAASDGRIAGMKKIPQDKLQAMAERIRAGKPTAEVSAPAAENVDGAAVEKKQ